MIHECEKGNLDIIFTKSLSCFGRDAKEGLEATRKIRASGKRIIFEKDKIDTDTVKDEFLISIIEAFEQAENDWKSENICLGLKYRVEDGTSGLYNRACYGYKKDKNGMLISHGEEARVVRRIYYWYLVGYSVGGIIDKMKGKKIKTSKGKERWSKRVVKSTFIREKYTGDVAIVNSGGLENQYLYKQHHEGIISKK